MMRKKKAKRQVYNHEKEWNEWRDMHQSLPEDLQDKIRSGASYKLSQDMKSLGCEGEGIGSSDISHSMFGIWRGTGKDKKMYIDEGITYYGRRLEEAFN